MRRRNLFPSPSDVVSKLDGNPNNWQDFVNGAFAPLPAGNFMFSCNVTQIGANPRIQIWNETTHSDLADITPKVGRTVIKANNPSAGGCHFSICGCEATGFAIESADTYALASVGGFRASSPQAPRHTDAVKAGDRQ